MSSKKKILPRITPNRDSKYMGLAWIHASFSKDPNTQVGAQIVSHKNVPLGSGYNGPPRSIDDTSFSWERPPKDNPNAFSKYDVIIHAEINAVDKAICNGYRSELPNAILYVTAMPCPKCILELSLHSINRIIYMDYQSSKSSTLQNTEWREKTFHIAELAGINLELFTGSIDWLADWTAHMKELGVFEMAPNT